MSVPANERSHGKLEASVKAHALCCYTLQITANEKVDESYAAWRNHASKGNSYRLLKRMDAYYLDLWGDNNGSN